MITSLRLVNFKNFADETLRVGPFTVIVGANASGKSNIRDAFRFLHGIGRGYTLAEILGGKYGAGGQLEWAGIRGAMNEITRFGQPAFSLTVSTNEFRYLIEVSKHEERSSAFVVTSEELMNGKVPIFRTHPIKGHLINLQGFDTHLVLGEGKPNPKGRIPALHVRGEQPALTQLRDHRSVAETFISHTELVIQVLANMRFLDLAPDQMREPTFPGAAALGDSGVNLATVLEMICADPGRQKILADWVEELTPMEVEGFEFPHDPSGRVNLNIRERNGRVVSAYSASDGTLRFLGILAALLGTNPAGLHFFEEIDNGLHSNRLWLLVELIEKQTANNGIQVITTTHSSEMLNLINDKTFEHTSVVCRLKDSDNSIMRVVDSLPNARKLRKTQDLGRLHASGWMEDMLTLTAWRDKDGKARE